MRTRAASVVVDVSDAGEVIIRLVVLVLVVYMAFDSLFRCTIDFRVDMNASVDRKALALVVVPRPTRSERLVAMWLMGGVVEVKVEGCLL